MSEQVNFIVEGEWLTDHIRTRFWDERESYESIEYFICRVLGCNKDDPETQDFIRGLLEGRVKLVGQNSFEVVDCDPSNYRPLTDRLSQLEKERALRAIQDDMDANPLEYVDTMTTYMSLQGAPVNNVNTYEELVDYFGYGKTRFVNTGRYYPLAAYETPTRAGLWLLEGGAALVYKIAGERGRRSPDFWDKVDAYTLGKDGFEERNLRVKAHKRRHATSSQVYKRDLESYEQILTSEEAIRNRKPVQPDDHESQYGLISPSGQWFSCGWAEHETLARRIIETYWSELDFSNASQYRLQYEPRYFETETEVTSDEEAIEWAHIHDSLTFLIQELNWVVLRYDNNCGWQLLCPDSWSTTHARPTKQQSNCVWDQLVAHQISDTVMNSDYFI